jgi:protein gp37
VAAVSDNTKISWTDSTWPVTTGCEHCSEGCDLCFSARLTSGRLKHLPAYQGLAEDGRFNGQVRLLPDRLDWPYKWRKPRKIFVADMSDLFYAQVPDDYIERVFDVMDQCPRHTFQVLTKRHARMRSFARARQQRDEDYARAFETSPIPARRTCPAAGWARQRADNPPANVWLGVSAENQHWAGIRVPSLLDTPASVRFVSAEPLLGPIDFGDLNGVSGLDRDWTGGPGGGTGAPHPLLNWVIVGGESGPGHRPMDIAWLESIVAQCKDAGVAVWVKQDSGPRAGQQGRIPDDLWIHEFPLGADLAGTR